MIPLRVAVIGGGHLGRIHTRLLKGLSEVELVAVVEPSAATRQQIQEQFEVPVETDYHRLSGRVDGVVIATPTCFHHKIATWSLRHRIHTFVEKPLVTSATEAEQLTELALQRDCVLQVGHVERFNPAWIAAAPFIEAPRFIQATRAGTYTGRSTDIGVVFDLMIHDLDLILQAVQSPIVDIDATGMAILGQWEDTAEARLQFANGSVASLRASRISQQCVREMHVHAARHMVQLDFQTGTLEITEPAPEVVSRRFQADMLPFAERLQLKDELFTKWLPKRKVETQSTNALENELLDFVAAMRGEKEPVVTAEHARQAIQAAEQILRAIQFHEQLASQATASRSGHLQPNGLATSLNNEPLRSRFQGPLRDLEPRRRAS